VTKGCLVKTVGDAFEQVPLKWIVCFGVGRAHEGMRKRKEEEGSVERETHCLAEEQRMEGEDREYKCYSQRVYKEEARAQPWTLIKCEGMKRKRKNRKLGWG
jgi:hypothetical protein